MKSNNTYVIIGSNCFSGSHMVDELLKDPANYVVGVSRSPEKPRFYLPYDNIRKNFEFHQIDVVKETDKLINLLDQVRPDYIIHFAALSEVGLSNFRPVEYFQTNCLSVVALCNQLISRQYYLKRYIHISTAEVYGNCEIPVTEISPVNPSTPYAVSKVSADFYLRSLNKVFGFPVIIVRSTNVYGKHQLLHKIIPRTIIYLKTGRKIELHGDGAMIRCFLHIRDLVQGVKSIVEKGRIGDVYHFSSPDEKTIANIVESMCSLMGYDFKSVTVSSELRPGADKNYLLDSSKAISELNWNPKINLNDGIKEVKDWIENNWEQVLKEPHIYQHV